MAVGPWICESNTDGVEQGLAVGGAYSPVELAGRCVLVHDRRLFVDDDDAVRRLVKDLEHVEGSERSAAGRHRRAVTSGSHRSVLGAGGCSLVWCRPIGSRAHALSQLGGPTAGRLMPEAAEMDRGRHRQLPQDLYGC